MNNPAKAQILAAASGNAWRGAASMALLINPTTEMAV
jgi:hypothetical protein